MKVSLTSILFSLVLLTACGSNKYKISGTVEGVNDGKLLLSHDLQRGTPSDTIIVKNGKFSFEGTTDNTALCYLYYASRNEIGTTFFLEPGNINISLVEQPGGNRIGGTLCNDRLQEYNDSIMAIGKRINRIAEHVYGNNLPEGEQQKAMEQIDGLQKHFTDYVIKSTEKNIDNEFGYLLLTSFPQDLFDNDTRIRLIDKLPADKQQRPEIIRMKQIMEAKAKTAEGKTISDFSQQTLDGSELSIMSEVRKNKITVIDFWASWCGPCRKEMPFMKRLYSQYKGKGLGIVGISLDNDYDSWKQGTDQLGIAWPQMSDLKGWDNAVARQFNIVSIPQTIVVDQNGKILRRGLRGNQLESFIAEQLK